MFSKKFNIFEVLQRITHRHGLNYEVIFILRDAQDYYIKEYNKTEIYNNNNFDYYYNFVNDLRGRGVETEIIFNELIKEIQKGEL